ncbi:MAG: hypothetical protein K2O00_01875 [Muribaculaceae bacterium]|nr:hypothetical protein [Muribaculaceae bacterium]
MRYFVTVTLSHHEVTLKYYRDDDGLDRLIPLQGADAQPLAIHINDSDIIVGKEALNRFEASQPNTFYNLFSLIETSDTYRRFDLRKSTSHLIYLAIENLLAPALLTQLGVNLNDSRQTIPIGFNFKPDVEKEERRHVISLFEKGSQGDCGGYANVGEIDADSRLAQLAFRNNHRNHALVIHTVGQDLAVTLYDKSDLSQCIGSKVMKEIGIDRRIMNGVKLIKSYIKYKNPIVDFAPVESRLEKIVEDFIESGNSELNSKVNINGVNYRFLLRSDDLKSEMASMERQYVGQHIVHFLRNNSVQPEDTIMVLASPRLQNAYFLPIFKEYFESVYCVTPQQTDEMQRKVIEDIVKNDYNFNKEVQRLKSLEKKWSELNTYIRNVMIPGRQFEDAVEDAREFLSELHSAAIPDTDKNRMVDNLRKTVDDLLRMQKEQADREVEEQKPRERERLEREEREQREQEQREREQRERDERKRMEEENRKQQNNNRFGGRTDRPGVDYSYYDSLIESFSEEIEQFVQYGDLKSAANSYSSLLQEIRGANLEQRYAGLLARLKQQVTPVATPPKHTTATTTHTPPPAPAGDDMASAIRARDFRKARKICRDRDDVNNYQKMKELDDAYKKFVVAEKYYSQYVAEHNTVAIQRAIREIKEYSALLDSIREPHPEVDKLLNQYNNAG